MEDSSLTVIFPAYNEEVTIYECLMEYHSIFPLSTFIVVDNNSEDETSKQARLFFDQTQHQGVVIKEYRRGKGYALSKGLTYVNSKYFLLTDSDLTYSAKDAGKLYDYAIRNQLDMAVGNRINGGMYATSGSRKGHMTGNRLISLLITKSFKYEIGDALSGLRVLSNQLVKNYPALVSGFEVETDLTIFAIAYGYNVDEIPIEYRKRPEGSESKLNTFTDGIKIFKTIFNLYRHYKPLQFFSILGAIFITLSVFFGLPVISQYIESGFIDKMPSAILATGLAMLSAISFHLGIALDGIKHHTRIILNVIQKK